MFSSLSNLVWGAGEELPDETNNEQVSFDDSKIIEDDWVLVEEISNDRRQEEGSSLQDERASSLQALFEENKPEPDVSGSRNEKDSSQDRSSQNENSDSNVASLGNLCADKPSDDSEKSSLEILFAQGQPNEGEKKDDSDCSMKTDESEFGQKSSLQFLFEESLHEQGSSAGHNSTSVFTLKPLPDPPIVLAPNAGQSSGLYKSYSADCYRLQPETFEPTVLRRRHVSRASKRSGEGASAMVGHVVLQKKTKQPSEGTSGVGRGEETRRRTRRANSVASGQNESTHGKRRKKTADKSSGKGGRRNC